MSTRHYTDDTICINGLTYAENKRLRNNDALKKLNNRDQLQTSKHCFNDGSGSRIIASTAEIEEKLSQIAEWIQGYAKTHKVYLLTFMFKEMDCNNATRLARMRDEIRRFFATLLPNVCRKTSGNANPLWLIAAPDLPVSKGQKKKSREHFVYFNDGLHYHAIILVPRSSKLKTGLLRHLEHCDRGYIRPDRPLLRLDARRLRTPQDIDRASVYALKGIKRQGLSADDIVVLT